MSAAERPCIWILNHYATTPDLPGGTRHFDVAKALAAKGYTVAVFASSFSHAHYVDSKLTGGERWKVEVHDGVTFVWIRTFPYRQNDWRRYLNMLSYLVNVVIVGYQIPRRVPALSRPRVVMGSSVHLLAVLAGWLLAMLYRARFVMEVRDIWPETLVNAGHMSSRHPVVLALSVLEGFLYRRAAHIVYVPPLAGPFLEARGIAREKITWVPNGADLSRFTVVETAGGPNTPPVVMYVGALGRTNGVEVILKAAQVLRRRNACDVTFEIVGDGPEKPRLEALRDLHGLSNVRLGEPVPKREVPALLARADFLILCEQNLPKLSKYGSSPNKFYDYLASGKPVIVSSDFIKDNVQEAGFGLRVPPEDEGALADAIETLVRMHAPERSAMGQRGRAYAETNFAMPVIVTRLLASAFGEVRVERSAS